MHKSSDGLEPGTSPSLNSTDVGVAQKRHPVPFWPNGNMFSEANHASFRFCADWLVRATAMPEEKLKTPTKGKASGGGKKGFKELVRAGQRAGTLGYAAAKPSDAGTPCLAHVRSAGCCGNAR